MECQKKAFAATVIFTLVLASCGTKTETEPLEVSGAKSGVAVLRFFTERTIEMAKPGGTLGVFSGLYLAQGVILPVKTAVNGIDVMRRFIEAEGSSDTDENFALLREVGGILQVNIVDALNRAEHRATVIDEYTASLRNAIILLDRKFTELEALEERQAEELREKRTAARDVKRKLDTALKEQDYGQAADLESELAAANAAFAEIETKEERTGDMLSRIETLKEVAARRLEAIEKNREILIAGLKVINVPGISDLNILEEGRSWRKRGGSEIFE